MKTPLFFIVVLTGAITCSLQKANAQNWLLSGNSDANNSSKLGTLKNFPLKFYTNKTEKMRIDQTGNVGIGTMSPTAAGTGAKSLQLSATNFPQYILEATNAAANNKVWRTIARNNNIFQIQTLSDAYGNEQTALQINRNANTISTVSFPNGNIGIGTTTPGFPLSFPNVLGDKISLWGASGSHFGFGIQNALLQIYTDNSPADVAFGYGSSSAFTETMRIKGNGNVGIGTSNPTEKLQIGGTNSGILLGSSLIKQSGANLIINAPLGSNPPPGDLILQTKSGSLFAGRVGIGTTTPQQKLSISAGMNIDQDNTNNGTISPGIIFGNNSGEGIASKRTNGGNTYGLDFYTFYAPRMSITNGGNVGIGTTSPQYPLDVTTSSVFNAIRAINTAPSGNGLVAECNNGSVPFGVEGVCTNTTSGYAGFFSGNLHYTGALTGPSDQKLKENIKPLDNVLDKIMRLKPSSYNFKNEYKKMNLPQGEQVGFIAQDMEKVFPQLVKTVGDKQLDSGKIFEYKGINYIGLIPLLTKAIQDQQEEINELKELVNHLTSNADLSQNAMSSTIVDNSKALLNQNIPNPFNNSSSISYNIPSDFHKAQLVITDVSGHVLKTFPIKQSGSGKQIISGNELASGVYQYSLLIDGKVIDTKKIAIAK